MNRCEIDAPCRRVFRSRDNKPCRNRAPAWFAKHALPALLLLLPGIVFAAVASENFDGITAQIIANTHSTNKFDGWEFGQGLNDAQIAFAGENNGPSFTNGLTNQYAGDQGLFLNWNGIPNSTYTGSVTHFFLRSADLSNFQLDSLQVGNNLSGYGTLGTITILSNGGAVGSAFFDLTTSSSADGITYVFGGDSGGGSTRPYGTFSFDSKYRNVDEIDLDFSDSSTPIFDNLNVSSAVVNAAPTVSNEPTSLSFEENTKGNLDLAGTTFADANGDALTVTLALNAGTFGQTVADGSGVGGGVSANRVSDTEVMLSGAAADINTYLDTPSDITDVPPLNVFGLDVATLTISATDGFDGLAFDPTVRINVIPPPTPAPTLANWSRMLLTILLAMMGGIYMPRRYTR